MFSQGIDGKFPRLVQAESILLAHAVGMELNCIRLPDEAVHIYGFDGEDTGVLALCDVPNWCCEQPQMPYLNLGGR